MILFILLSGFINWYWWNRDACIWKIFN